MSNGIPRDLRETREQMFNQMERRLQARFSTKDRVFYYHSSEDRIVLSHALFWVLTKELNGKIAKEKFLLLMRQYQEEMLEAWLTEDDYFHDLLRYCNIFYDTLPMILQQVYNLSSDKDARRLAAIAIVASGYGGDMSEDLCYGLLDDIDFDDDGKVKCSKIEQLLPQLRTLVANEMKSL